MDHEARLKAFAQSVILRMTGKHMDADDLNGEEGAAYLLELVDWVNQFLDEIELEADWNYVRELDAELGTVSAPTSSLSLPPGVRKLAVAEHRPLRIYQDGTPVSVWDVVRPNMISATRDTYPLRERVTYVSKNVVFSRPLNEGELGGTVMADVINKIPRIVYTDGGADNDTSVLDLVEPKQLLVLGVAKNATLPDFVRGGISPSLVQQYADLLGKAIGENNATATSDEVERDDYSGLGGLY